jgi:hypothetical protein
LEINIPIPSSFEQTVWLGLGLTFGRGLGKKFDFEVQKSAWFTRRSPFTQELLKRLLDCLHHWWMGALLMLYGASYTPLFWFGAGLLIDDMADIPDRIKGYFKVEAKV